MTRDREDTESRGPVGGPREAGQPVAPDDEYGSKRGAAESQESHEAAEPQEIAIDEQASPADSAHVGVGKGEEVGLGGKEPGREATGTSGADRPSGKRTARDSTGMGGVEPTDPEMPDMPPA